MRRSILAVVWPLMVAVGMSGCSNWIVGDSLTVLSTGHILQGNASTAIDADYLRGAHSRGVVGLPDGWASVLAHVDDVPVGGWLVVQLGTNDLTRPVKEWQTFVNAVVARVPNDRCLAWVTPYHPEYQRQAAVYEYVVRAAITRQPCRAVIHWDQVAKADPGLTDDGFHPNDAGATTLACMINSVLYHSCRATKLITRG